MIVQIKCNRNIAVNYEKLYFHLLKASNYRRTVKVIGTLRMNRFTAHNRRLTFYSAYSEDENETGHSHSLTVRLQVI